MPIGKLIAVTAAAGVGAWALYRVVKAVQLGVSPLSALKHPSIDVRVAELADHPERQQTRSGAGHFG